MTTILSNFPESIRKHYECKLLHEKKPYWNGEFVELDGEIYRKLEWYCEVCNGPRI
jgi:hypothetical protein